MNELDKSWVYYAYMILTIPLKIHDETIIAKYNCNGYNTTPCGRPRSNRQHNLTVHNSTKLGLVFIIISPASIVVTLHIKHDFNNKKRQWRWYFFIVTS